jgi:hypothetical protein
MRQKAVISGLLLVAVGVILGATVFRTDIAQATGLAQSVTVANTPLPVQTPIPASAFSADVSLGDVGVVSGPDPAGTKYAITGVVVANTDATPTFVRVAARYGSISDCTNLSGTVGTNEIPIFAPSSDTVSVSFTQPYVIKAAAGSAACLIVAPSFAGGGRAAIVGYRIN